MAERIEKEKRAVQDRLNRAKEQINSRMDALRDESTFPGQGTREQVLAWKDQAMNNKALLAGGATGLGTLMAFFMGGDEEAEGEDVERHALTEEYVDRLAQVVARRLRAGWGLDRALGETLRERTPLFLTEPEEESHTSAWGWLLGIGLLAAAGFGLNYAAKTFLGKDLLALLQGDEDESYTVRQAYPPVHGTAGAEMPDPQESTERPAASPARRGEGDRVGESSDVRGTAGAEMPNPNGS